MHKNTLNYCIYFTFFIFFAIFWQ